MTLKPNDLPDYDSARELAWALRMIYSDLNPKPADDAKIQERLEALNRELGLSLPSGSKQSILDELPANRQKLNTYDPYRFRAILKEISAAADCIRDTENHKLGRAAGFIPAG